MPPLPRTGSWLLYLAVPLVFVLLMLEARAPLPASYHLVMRILIVIIVFGLVDFWIMRFGPWCCRDR
jgi:hypothetical protein